jgi:hypothetical protein
MFAKQHISIALDFFPREGGTRDGTLTLSAYSSTEPHLQRLECIF